MIESLNGAEGPTYIEVSDTNKKQYLGDYKYGNAPNEGFTVKLNMRKMLSLGPIGEFGGAIYKIDDNKFIYNGSPSVQISFNFLNKAVHSLTIKDPDFTLTATKV